MSRLRLLGATSLAVLVAAAPAVAQTTGTDATGTTTAPGTTTAAAPEITAEQAGPGILLDAADRVELASSLAEATAESDVCFGYVLRLGGSGTSDRDETLTNAGPDRQPTGCSKGSVVLQVSLNYTSESSESEDSASFGVVTDVAGLTSSQATQRLKDLTGVDDGDLLGNDDDLALRNLTAALPLMLDDAVPAELAAPAAKAPNGDRLTGSPGSDWLREHGLGIAIAFVLLIVALGLVLGGLLGRHRTRPTRDPGPSGDGPSSPSTTTT